MSRLMKMLPYTMSRVYFHHIRYHALADVDDDCCRYYHIYAAMSLRHAHDARFHADS